MSESKNTGPFEFFDVKQIKAMPVEPTKLVSAFPIDEASIPRREDRGVWKAHAATNLSLPPWYRCDEKVTLRGEALDLIIWQGRQWAVTSFGLECRDGLYAIGKERLWENEKDWGWVNQLGEKNWIDLQDFAEALRIARGHHGKR